VTLALLTMLGALLLFAAAADLLILAVGLLLALRIYRRRQGG
jgi:hypothetical protein